MTKIMTDHTRRTLLKAAGASTFAIAVAGCLGSDDNDNDGDDGNDDGNNDAGAVDGFEIDAGTEIEFDGYTQYWEGLEPADIAGEQNPTLVLEEGGEYTMTWINADGVTHDLQIWDDNGDLVDDLATESIGAEGDSDSLEFEATAEMTTYICQYHTGSQVGDIVVE